MSENREILEHDVAVGVIEMAVSVDQHSQRLAGRRTDCVPEHPPKARILLSIDDEHPVRGLDCTGVGIAAGPDPSMDAWGHGHEPRFIYHAFSPYDRQIAIVNS